MLFKILSGLSGACVFAGFTFFYIPSIVRGETKPSKASWIVWGGLDVIILAGMYAKHAVNYQILASTVFAILVTALAYHYGTSDWAKREKQCLKGSALGLFLWWLFASPVLGIVMSLAITIYGSWPTFESAWESPGREDKWAWTVFSLGCVFSVAAIPRWTWADAAQPVVFTLIEAVMMYILFIRPYFAKPRA